MSFIFFAGTLLFLSGCKVRRFSNVWEGDEDRSIDLHSDSSQGLCSIVFVYLNTAEGNGSEMSKNKTIGTFPLKVNVGGHLTSWLLSSADCEETSLCCIQQSIILYKLL